MRFAAPFLAGRRKAHARQTTRGLARRFIRRHRVRVRALRVLCVLGATGGVRAGDQVREERLGGYDVRRNDGAGVARGGTRGARGREMSRTWWFERGTAQDGGRRRGIRGRGARV